MVLKDWAMAACLGAALGLSAPALAEEAGIDGQKIIVSDDTLVRLPTPGTTHTMLYRVIGDSDEFRLTKIAQCFEDRFCRDI